MSASPPTLQSVLSTYPPLRNADEVLAPLALTNKPLHVCVTLNSQIVKECERVVSAAQIQQHYTRIWENICPKIINIAKYDTNKQLQAELASYDVSYATGE